MRSLFLFGLFVLVSCTKNVSSPPVVSSSTFSPMDSGGISVSGQCLKKVIQDRGALTLSTVITAPTSREASDRAVEAHEKMKAEVKALNLKDGALETAGY